MFLTSLGFIKACNGKYFEGSTKIEDLYVTENENSDTFL
jgi:hypothetical protein